MAFKICYEKDCVEIVNALELRIALDLIPPEAHLEMLKPVKDNLIEIIKTDSEFLLILRKVMGVKGEKKKEFLALFGNKIGKVITMGDTLARALAILANEDDQEFLLQSLKQKGIKNCISNFYDIIDCLEWLFGKMDKLFIELVGWEYVINHIQTGESLGLILRFLEEKEERELLEKMGWDSVLECIQTPKDFSYVLMGMDKGNERALIEKMTKEKLRKVLPFEVDFNRICKELTSEDIKLLKQKYKN